MTVGGVLSAGPATNALEQELSVPGQEGSVTNVEIAKRYGGTGGEAVPLVPVVTLPGGQDRRLPGRPRASLAQVDATPRARAARRAVASLRLDRRPRVRLQATAAPPSRSSTRSRTGLGRSATTRRPRAARAALRDATVAGAPVHVTGFDALDGRAAAATTGPGVLLEALIGGIGALVVLGVRVRLVPGGGAAADGGRRRS